MSIYFIQSTKSRRRIKTFKDTILMRFYLVGTNKLFVSTNKLLEHESSSNLTPVMKSDSTSKPVFERHAKSVLAESVKPRQGHHSLMSSVLEGKNVCEIVVQVHNPTLLWYNHSSGEQDKNCSWRKLPPGADPQGQRANHNGSAATIGAEGI